MICSKDKASTSECTSEVTIAYFHACFTSKVFELSEHLMNAGMNCQVCGDPRTNLTYSFFQNRMYSQRRCQEKKGRNYFERRSTAQIEHPSFEGGKPIQEIKDSRRETMHTLRCN